MKTVEQLIVYSINIFIQVKLIFLLIYVGIDYLLNMLFIYI